jgi:hypothetical protein
MEIAAFSKLGTLLLGCGIGGKVSDSGSLVACNFEISSVSGVGGISVEVAMILVLSCH